MSLRRTPSPPFKTADVAAKFAAYPDEMRSKLLRLRNIVFETAAATEGVGRLTEALKWGEPAFLTPDSKSGSTVRIDWKERAPRHYAIYFKCTTNLVETFKKRYPETFTFEGSRAIVFAEDEEIPDRELRDCIALALTYHLWKPAKPAATRASG